MQCQLFFVLPKELSSLLELYCAASCNYHFLTELKHEIKDLVSWIDGPGVRIVHVFMDKGCAWWQYSFPFDWDSYMTDLNF